MDHGRASRAVDASKANLPYSEDTHCQCCQRQIPEYDDMYDLYGEGSNTRLGELGEGFPLMLQLVKYITWLLLFLSLIYFVPAAMMIVNVLSKIEEKAKAQSPITKFSFGAFVKFSNPYDTDSYVPVETRQAQV